MVGIGTPGESLRLMQLGMKIIKTLLRLRDLIAESFDTHFGLMQFGRVIRGCSCPWGLD